ncbi:MAG: NAD-dependent epimerase/dehydratase family protein, partial [Candidatus Dadabacteria bacterium]|nr:NAD-dependent epimerase/dehydratase family protein [Candidatus Dadabacteria bacterium]
PGQCWKNNCDLMFNMLEFARKEGVRPKLFLHCSTDEVYGEASPGKAHHEWDVIMPSNVYSASKAAQEALAIAYWRTYDVPVVIVNCMNMIGE